MHDTSEIGCYTVTTKIPFPLGKLRVLYSSCSGKGRWEPFFWEQLPDWWAIALSIIINLQLQGSKELSLIYDRRTNTLILDCYVEGSLWERKYETKTFFYMERLGTRPEIMMVTSERNSRR